MKYENPVLRGFYPDPSVCFADGRYYMVCSSFQYFPGVPLFESRDLVNWTQIGHVLTRPEQITLKDVPSSGGVFAPTIRYHNGRFYMTTTNNSTGQNFYVWTDDVHGQWSDPICVEQDGIDPSLLFADGKAYFTSTGRDDFGVSGIIQCELDIATGRKLTPSKCIWHGSGGRFLEGPHLYKLDGWYYLFASEGGTEYGHMMTLARSRDPWGPFENCQQNPILTNRNKAPYPIQGIGHGDLVQGPDGNWYLLSLGFRQTGTWMPYHHLGREVFLTPVEQTADGWFRCGTDGTTDQFYEVPIPGSQVRKQVWTFENTDWNIDWCFLRHPDRRNYQLGQGSAVLLGTDVSLNQPLSPTFVGLRQREMSGLVRCSVSADGGEAGLTAYMTEQEHYDVGIRHTETGFEAFLRLRIGEIDHIQKSIPLKDGSAALKLVMEPLQYHFYVNETDMGFAQTKYLSSEVAGGFTGVLLGLYAAGGSRAEFHEFECKYADRGGMA